MGRLHMGEAREVFPVYLDKPGVDTSDITGVDVFDLRPRPTPAKAEDEAVEDPKDLSAPESANSSSSKAKKASASKPGPGKSVSAEKDSTPAKESATGSLPF